MDVNLARATGRKLAKRLQKARDTLDRLVGVASEAIGEGRLPLRQARFEAAVAALREFIPASP